MSKKKTPSRLPSDELTLTRTFDASRDLVFKAWTDPVRVAQWWGPDGFTTTMKKWEPRPGGALRLDMNAPNGVVYPMSGRFIEVEPPEKLVFTGSALDKEGNAIFEIMNTISLADEGGKTRLTLHARVLSKRSDADQYLEGQKAGWTQSLDRLEALVTRKRR